MSYTDDDRARLGLRESATFDRPTIAAIQRAAETGIYDIRGWGAKRPLPHFDDLLFLGASMSRYPLEGYRERCGTDVVLGDRHAKHPLHLDIPVTIAGMSFGALSGQAKEALGRGASEVGHVDHHRRRRHDTGGTRPEQTPGLPVPSVALRDEPRRPAQGRRHRGRARPGRQARRRRNAAGAEDLRTRRGYAHAAAGHRPALRVPAPGLDRPRRPDHQDQRTARDHRLGEADLRQGRCHPHLLRREARRARRRRRRRGRRHAGRHRRHPGRVHRARRHPDAGRRPAGRAGLGRSLACTAQGCN